MTARVWTREDLDRVHPLPDGWEWDADPSVGWYALHRSGSVCVDDSGDVLALFNGTERFDSPAVVCLAVILASQGMDSREAMATALDVLADAADAEMYEAAHTPASDRAEGRSDAFEVAAAMLRRGTVQP
jgi:hypothetical protein